MQSSELWPFPVCYFLFLLTTKMLRISLPCRPYTFSPVTSWLISSSPIYIQVPFLPYPFSFASSCPHHLDLLQCDHLKHESILWVIFWLKSSDICQALPFTFLEHSVFICLQCTYNCAGSWRIISRCRADEHLTPGQYKTMKAIVTLCINCS
jgi:hypothetical protein